MKINNIYETLEVIKNKTRKLKTKYNVLKEIIIEHPEIILKSKQPDKEILYYLQIKRQINIDMSLEEYESKMIPLSTIRNFRQNLIVELKKEGIYLENSDKTNEKANFVRKEMREDQKELGSFS